MDPLFNYFRYITSLLIYHHHFLLSLLFIIIIIIFCYSVVVIIIVFAISTLYLKRTQSIGKYIYNTNRV